MRMGMVVYFVMLPQQIAAVVVAVGRAHDRVNMVPGRFRIVPEKSRQVIELDQD